MALTIAANICGTICVGFGINALLRPDNALSFFEIQYPTRPAERNVIDALMMVYGARDIFMGLAIYAAAFFGSRRTVGFLLLCVAGVAGVDGWVCKNYVGHGEWNHWGYAPLGALLGAIMLGG